MFSQEIESEAGKHRRNQGNSQNLGLHTWTEVLLSNEIGKVRNPGRKPNPSS